MGSITVVLSINGYHGKGQPTMKNYQSINSRLFISKMRLEYLIRILIGVVLLF